MKYSNDLHEILEKIKNDIDFQGKNHVELWRKNKMIHRAGSDAEIKQFVAENIEPPEKNKEVFIVKYTINPNSEYPFSFSIVLCNITPKLKLISSPRNIYKPFYFTEEELFKYGYKKKYLLNLFDKIKKKKIFLDPFHVQTFSDFHKKLTD